jgi:NAD-dependent deacetylase
MKTAVAAQDDAYQQVVACKSSLDAQWAEFQRKFDELTKSALDKLSGVLLPNGSSGLRPAEQISVSRAAQSLKRSRQVVVLTGAGISAESGIPTFRGSDGYWTVGSENYRPQELATWEKWNEMPDELWKWYQYRWGVCRRAKPNDGHRALVELEGLVHGGYTLATQNIDGLHLQAGSDPLRLCEIHGRIDEMRCDEQIEGACLHGLNLNDPANSAQCRATVQKTPEPAKDERDEPLPHCARCGVRQRPKILWFDENYNEAFFKYNTVLEAMRGCDLLFIIGTQLTTGLPSRMVQEARKAGAIIIRLDPNTDMKDPSSAGMLHLIGKSGEVLPRLVSELRALSQEEPVFPPPLAQALDEDAGSRPGSAGGPKSQFSQVARKASSSSKSSSVSRAVPGQQRPQQALALRAAASASLVSRSSGSVTRSTRSGSVSAGVRPSVAHEPSAVRAAAPRAALGPATGGACAKEQVTGIFVYGTLRPDDDSGASWTKGFCDGFRAEPASLEGASLYVVEKFPALCFEQTRCSVRGVLLTPAGGDEASLMASKLREADRIEGYPEFYKRAVARVQLANGKMHTAFVYHRTGLIDRSSCPCIADGDWLSRRR